MNTQQMKQALEDILQNRYKLGISVSEKLRATPNLAIYGAGNLGKQLYRSITKEGGTVSCFFDRTAQPGQTLFGLPVYQADDEALLPAWKEETTVVLAIFLTIDAKASVVAFLNINGYQNVIDNYSLLAVFLPFEGGEAAGACIHEQANKINAAAALLADDHSRAVFCSNLKAHCSYDYDNTLISAGMTQYFDVQIPFKKGYTHFVDCGAFTGDSLQELVKRHRLETYIGFEPDPETFQTLSDTVDSLQDQFTNAYLYPCATGSSASFAQFNASMGGSSAISEAGTQTVQVVALDKILKNKDITMLKMDIEGAEADTLHGAKRIISTQKPDLAICVYHKVSDIWEFPLLLHEWVPQYRFYLRCHHSATMETVLYATT